jgi:hypothetical protein
MKIKTVAIGSISQDPANLRKHGERNIDAIVASLRKFGQQHPIVIDSKGIILSGNGRYMAAVKLGWSDIKVVESSLTGSAATAYAIADNRTAELAEWDTTALAETLRALQSEEFDTTAAGYTDGEIDALVEGLGSELLGADKEIVEDEIPEPPVDPITRAGDLWILGEHRVLCGDSTKAADVARLMDGVKAGCLITDPPYGIDWQGSNASTLKWEGIQNDTGQLDLLPILSSYDVVVSFGANCYPHQLPHRGRWIVWDKRVNENADKMIGSPFELAWSSKSSGFDKIYRVMHGGVVNADGHNARREHPTQKPIKLLAAVIKDFAEGLILDLFLGSGTTLLAAQQLNRKCYGMEISPQYCDVIVKRWENLTGMVAVREPHLRIG